MRWYLVFPLLSSLIYVGGALYARRAADLGAGPWRMTFVSNVATGVVFLALLPLGGQPIDAALMWQPIVVGALFVVAQLLTFLALDRGDVSVATPALGAKTVVVAWLATVLLHESLPWQLWGAAVLSFLAIILLHGGGGKAHRNTAMTIVLSLLSAAGYALFDILVQKWSPAWGAGRFLPLAMGFTGVLSIGFIPLFRGPLRELPRNTWGPVAGAASLFALQSLFIVITLARFGDATAVNVIYSARGLWSVIAVWLIGHWFGNTERDLDDLTLRYRLVGAVVMTAAIVVTLTR